MAAARNIGYYMVHCTNLNVPDVGARTGTMPGYWDGDYWNLLYIGDGRVEGPLSDDSHVDHVSPQFAGPEPSQQSTTPPPRGSSGWYWIKPDGMEDWQVGWTDGRLPTWLLPRDDTDPFVSRVDAYGPLVQEPGFIPG